MTVPSADKRLETLRRGFLAAAYQHHPDRACSLYRQIVAEARQGAPSLSENQEKVLRQAQAACKRFFPRLPELIPIYRDLKQLLVHIVKTQTASVTYRSFEAWYDQTGLSIRQVNRVIENAVTVQLTTGCSHFCRRCNEWALPGIRGHFSRRAVDTLLRKLIAAGNTDTCLYGASDPLDWTHDTVRLPDLLTPVAAQTAFSLLTKLPRAGTTAATRLIQQGIPLSVSVTDRNRTRVTALENRLGQGVEKQHDANDLLIPAGLDDDFSSVKSSITDAYGTEITPHGAFAIIPTFTSALYPMGHLKITITPDCSAVPVKKIGRPALLVDYFKPVEMIGRSDTPFYARELMDVQAATILLDSGSMSLSPPGMRNLKEYFTIFDEPARIRRRHMTRSVIQGLTRAWVSPDGDKPPGGYRCMAPDRKQAFRRQIAGHLSFCRRQTVSESRHSAAAYFLAAVRRYLGTHDTEKQMIAYLVHDEADHLERRFGPAANRAARAGTTLMSDPETDFFHRFRFYVTALVFNRQKEAVDRYIASHPSRYDPAWDRFVPDQ